MGLRSTRVAPTILTQVGHEGNPTETTALTVVGTLDGTPTLGMALFYKATQDAIDAAAARV